MRVKLKNKARPSSTTIMSTIAHLLSMSISLCYVRTQAVACSTYTTFCATLHCRQAACSSVSIFLQMYTQTSDLQHVVFFILIVCIYFLSNVWCRQAACSSFAGKRPAAVMFIVVQTFAIESRLQQCLIACFLCKQMTQTSLNVCTLYFTADKQPAAVAYMFCVLCFTADKRPAAVSICSVCFITPQTSGLQLWPICFVCFVSPQTIGLQQCVYVLCALFHRRQAACSSVYMFCMLCFTAWKRPAAVSICSVCFITPQISGLQQWPTCSVCFFTPQASGLQHVAVLALPRAWPACLGGLS